MGKYKNLNDSFKLSELKEVDITKNIDYSKNNIEYYFLFEHIREYGTYQLVKSDEHTNSDIISEWSDDFIKDGNDDSELKKNFDETNEIYHDDFRTICIFKIRSEKFNIIFNNKLNEYKKDEYYDEYSGFRDFCDWLTDDCFNICPEGSVTHFINSLTEDEIKIETLVDEEEVDFKNNILEWGSWMGTNETNIKLLSREIEN